MTRVDVARLLNYEKRECSQRRIPSFFLMKSPLFENVNCASRAELVPLGEAQSTPSSRALQTRLEHFFHFAVLGGHFRIQFVGAFKATGTQHLGELA